MSNTTNFPHARPPYEVDNFPDLDESTYPLAHGKDCKFAEGFEAGFNLVETEPEDTCIKWTDYIKSEDSMNIPYGLTSYWGYRPTLPGEGALWYSALREGGENLEGFIGQPPYAPPLLKYNDLPYEHNVITGYAIAYTDWAWEDPELSPSEHPTKFFANFNLDDTEDLCELLLVFARDSNYEPKTGEVVYDSFDELPFTVVLVSTQHYTLSESNTTLFSLGIVDGMFQMYWESDTLSYNDFGSSGENTIRITFK